MEKIFLSSYILFRLQNFVQLRIGVKAGHDRDNAQFRPQEKLFKKGIDAFQLILVGEIELKNLVMRPNRFLNQKVDFIKSSAISIDNQELSTG